MSYPKPMKYVRLGNSGLKVSKLILGCMSFGNRIWQDWVLEEKEAIEHIKLAYDAGINTFDTADMYSCGDSEIILGKALKQLKIPREDVVILTKVFFPISSDKKMLFGDKADELGYVNQHGLSRKVWIQKIMLLTPFNRLISQSEHIFASVKDSLKRLDLEYIDMLQCHRFDYNTPIEETMQALHDVVKAGYVRYIGMSSCWAWQFHVMQNYAISHNLTPFISMQNHYSLLYREEEREMMPTLEHFGVASIPWSPLARGLLARPWNETSKRAKSDGMVNMFRNQDSAQTIIKRVEEVAKKKGCSMAQISIAWTLTKVTAPIFGTTSLNNLQEMIDALKIELTDEEIKYLEEPYVPIRVIGHQ